MASPLRQKGKRDSSPRQNREQGKGVPATSDIQFPIGNQTARTHARTKRNDFQVEHLPTSDENVTPPPPSPPPSPLSPLNHQIPCSLQIQEIELRMPSHLKGQRLDFVRTLSHVTVCSNPYSHVIHKRTMTQEVRMLFTDATRMASTIVFIHIIISCTTYFTHNSDTKTVDHTRVCRKPIIENNNVFSCCRELLCILWLSA